MARPEVLAESGMAALECPTATSRRSFMGITNGSRRPQAAVARPQRLQPESTQSGCGVARRLQADERGRIDCRLYRDSAGVIEGGWRYFVDCSKSSAALNSVPSANGRPRNSNPSGKSALE